MKAARPIVGHKKARQNTSRQSPSSADTASGTAKTPIGLLIDDLRTQALTQGRGQLPDIQSPYKSLYGMLVEMALDDCATSLVTFSDGSTSWYVSSGHACIGCGEDATINLAARQLLIAAGELVDNAAAAQNTALPSQGDVQLILLTDTGTKRIEVHPRSNSTVLNVLRESQRLLQLIEHRQAGRSLEHAVLAQVASLATDASSNPTAKSELTCLSAGNAARRLRT